MRRAWFAISVLRRAYILLPLTRCERPWNGSSDGSERPIGLGKRSSVCSKVIERLYANSSDLSDEGQYPYYGRVGGCIITGNEAGIKHCSMGILYALQHRSAIPEVGLHREIEIPVIPPGSRHEIQLPDTKNAAP